MDINAINLANLTSLWKKYGAHSVAQANGATLWASNSWPYRCWVEGDINSREYLSWQMQHTPHSHKLSQFPLSLSQDDNTFTPVDSTNMDTQWQMAFQQTGMSLRMTQFNQALALAGLKTSPIKWVVVSDLHMLQQWLAVSSEAFGYEIDGEVLEALVFDPDIDIYLGLVNDEPALSAMLYHQDKITGLHQMGVKQDFQGQGLSKYAMYQLLLDTQARGSDYMVLQASDAGYPLYKKLGFQANFRLAYFTSESVVVKSDS